MVETNKYLLDNISTDLFNSNFRNFVNGFNELKFEGIDKRLSSSGGSGGLDPLFQIF